MTTKTMLAALEAVQSAMRAEAAAQRTFFKSRSPASEALWMAARVHTDATWARLWDLNRERVPDPQLSGQEWALSMRRNTSEDGSASGGSSAG